MSTEEQTAETEPTPAVEPDEQPAVKAAAEAVRCAKKEFEKACATYKHLRKEATDQVRKLRESTVGDVVEDRSRRSASTRHSASAWRSWSGSSSVDCSAG